MRNQKLMAILLCGSFVFTLALLRFNAANAAAAHELQVKQGGLALGCGVIDALDDCVQDRFRKTNAGFGFARVSTPQMEMHSRMFLPRSPAEVAVVAELEQSGWQTVLYLAGRRLLGPKPNQSALELGAPTPPQTIMVLTTAIPGGLLIGGPVVITRKNQKDEPPKPAALWEQGHKAIVSFSENVRANGYDFSIGNWKIEARPVRALEPCLKCHQGDAAQSIYGGLKKEQEPEAKPNPLRVGDPLGVVMYAYTRKK